MENATDESSEKVFTKGKQFEVKIDGLNEKYNVRAENFTELEKNVRLKIQIPETKNIKIMFDDLVICDDEDLDNVKEMEKGNKISLKVKFYQQTSTTRSNQHHARINVQGLARCNFKESFKIEQGQTFTSIGAMTVTAGEHGTALGVHQGTLTFSPTHVTGKGDGVTAATIHGEIQQEQVQKKIQKETEY